MESLLVKVGLLGGMPAVVLWDLRTVFTGRRLLLHEVLWWPVRPTEWSNWWSNSTSSFVGDRWRQRMSFLAFHVHPFSNSEVCSQGLFSGVDSGWIFTLGSQLEKAWRRRTVQRYREIEDPVSLVQIPFFKFPLDNEGTKAEETLWWIQEFSEKNAPPPKKNAPGRFFDF